MISKGLLVTSQLDRTVREYNGTTGGTFGGNLGVRRYDSTTGVFIDFFANTGSDLYVPIGITFGPDNNLYVATQNAAQLWLTLFFLGRKPPENITLLGAHDFESGDEIGSVSAASSAFSAYIGEQFKRVADNLTIG